MTQVQLPAKTAVTAFSFSISPVHQFAETSLEHVAALFYDTTELLSLSDKEELSCQSLNRRMIRIVTLFQRHKKTCIALLKGLEQ